MYQIINRRPQTIYFGTEINTRTPVRRPRKTLRTHLAGFGPTGEGKTKLDSDIFVQCVTPPEAGGAAFNFKGDAPDLIIDKLITTVPDITNRLEIFDPSNPAVRAGYNPFQPGHLSWASHAKMIREAIRAAWGQENFDQTPQLARFLFIALATVRQLAPRFTLVDAVRLLRPQSAVRRIAIAQVTDPFLRELLIEFERLDDSRKEQLAASCVGRLEAFLSDPLIRTIFTQPQSIDLDDIIRTGKILIVNLEIGNPLAETDAKLIARMMLNDTMMRLRGRKPEERTPFVIWLDECQMALTHDVAHALTQGRELNFSMLLTCQYPAQLLEEYPDNTSIYNSVMTCATNKIVFGNLHVDHLRPLAQEFVFDLFDPLAPKDEIYGLEIEPVETTRRIVTRGYSEGENWQDTTGTSHETTRSNTKGHGYGSHQDKTHGTTHTVGHAYGSSEMEARGTAHSIGRSHGSAEIDMDGSSSGFSSGDSASSAETYTIMPSGELVASRIDGAATINSLMSGTSHAHGVSTSDQETATDTQSYTHAYGTHEQWSESDAVNESDTTGTSEQWNESNGIAESEGTQSSKSKGGNRGRSITVADHPFYAQIKRRRVISRTFWLFEEFLMRCMQVFRRLPVSFYCLKSRGCRPLFLKARRIERPFIPSQERAAILAEVFAKPYYATAVQIEAQLAAEIEAQEIVAQAVAPRVTMKAPRRHARHSSSQYQPTTSKIPKPPTR